MKDIEDIASAAKEHALSDESGRVTIDGEVVARRVTDGSNVFNRAMKRSPGRVPYKVLVGRHNTRIMKVAISENGEKQNQLEVAMWKSCSGTNRQRLLCPIVDYGEGGLFIVMENVSDSKVDLHNLVEQTNFSLPDRVSDNHVGLYNGRPRLVQYPFEGF